MVFEIEKLDLNPEDTEDLKELIELGLVKCEIGEYILTPDGIAYADNEKRL